jgi:hypothetical protein
MDFQDLGSLGELIAAVATIATLIYLARQIRHNAGQLQSEAIIAINEIERSLVADLRSDEKLLRAWVKASDKWENASPDEQAKAHLYLHPYLRWCETCWLLWTRGGLDDVTYASREEMALILLRPDGARTWWKMVSVAFDPRFVAMVNSTLEKRKDEGFSILDLPFYDPEFWAKRNAT